MRKRVFDASVEAYTRETTSSTFVGVITMSSREQIERSPTHAHTKKHTCKTWKTANCSCNGLFTDNSMLLLADRIELCLVPSAALSDFLCYQNVTNVQSYTKCKGDKAEPQGRSYLFKKPPWKYFLFL